jgi:hypothetical protein
LRLAEIARTDREDFFRRHARWRPYKERVLCVALCQGAALHYVDRKNGVNDFDVYTFYDARPNSGPYPPRRHARADFGASKFGKQPGGASFEGRRVDLLGRSIARPKGMSWVQAVRHYVGSGPRGSTPWHLGRKAVVILEPKRYLGKVVWP